MRLPTADKASWYFALVNVSIGLTGFTGPVVTGNSDRLINIRPGKLFGVFAMNWAHALLHLGVGLIGFTPSVRTPAHYMKLNAVLFGTLTAAYLLRFRGRPGIHLMMGMAVNRPANLVHLAWTALGLLYACGRPDHESTLPLQNHERTQLATPGTWTGCPSMPRR